MLLVIVLPHLAQYGYPGFWDVWLAYIGTEIDLDDSRTVHPHKVQSAKFDLASLSMVFSTLRAERSCPVPCLTFGNCSYLLL